MPAALAQYASAVVARLEDSDWEVRHDALETLHELEPETLAQHASAVVARIEDADAVVRWKALWTLRKLEPETLAQHASAVVAMIEDADEDMRRTALETLGKLKPTMLAQHAHAVVEKLNDRFADVRTAALTTLKALPLVITRDVDFESHNLRERLLGRIAWYRCRLRYRLRLSRIALYWYALPYRPGGPGHAREVEAWGRIHVE